MIDLLQRISQARAALENVLMPLSEKDLVERRADDWPIKTHLAHLALWERGIAALLRHEERWEAMGLNAPGGASEYDDADAINALLYQQIERLSAYEALELLREAQEEMDTALGMLSDEDLLRGYAYYAPGSPGIEGDVPIVRWIIGNTYEHYEEHTDYIRQAMASDATHEE